jgi:predicted transcriptional regulator
MTTTIEIPSELAARLTAAGISSDEATVQTIQALTLYAAETEQNAVGNWWNNLTEEERDGERAKTRASLAAGDAGRNSTAKEVYDRIRRKQVRIRHAARG